MMVLVLVGLALLCLVAAVRMPFIFVGGLGGQGLECKLDHAKEPYFLCYHNNDWFRIWMSIYEQWPYLSLPCFLHNLNVDYNTTTHEYTSPDGVSIRPADFGGVGSVEYLLGKGPEQKSSAYMHEWIDFFVKYGGYERGVSFRAAPFDWRLGPHAWMNDPDWGLSKFKSLVEETFALNNSTKVHVSGHSLGAPYVGWFLSSYVSQEWKDKYIASFVSLSGPYDGAWMAPFLTFTGITYHQLFVKPTDPEWRHLVYRVGGSQWMTPSKYFMDRVFFHTDERNYTMNQYKDLCHDADGDVSYAIYEYDVKEFADKTAPPGVETFCLFGTGIPTMGSFYIPDLKHPTVNATVIANVSGDGVVHAESLAVCAYWGDYQKEPVYAVPMPNVSHTEVVFIPQVWEGILNLTYPDHPPIPPGVVIDRNRFNIATDAGFRMKKREKETGLWMGL